MKSIKPGRGPSAMNGAASIFVAVFGVIWIFAAISMGAPWFFGLFGLGFVLMAIMQAAYHFKNASSKERFSEYDVVDAGEEGDPAERFVRQSTGEKNQREDNESGREIREPEKEDRGPGREIRFCPYCGAHAEKGYRFCAECGKELPNSQ